MKFNMKIESDNADNGPEMVAAALEYVVARIDAGYTGGLIRDANGNHVGDWEMKEDRS